MPLQCGASITVRLLGAAGAVLLASGIASAQSNHQAASASQGRPKARLQTVASISSTSVSRRNKKQHKRASSRQHGQQKIDATRSREIQEALIREHYLEGTSSGVWDAKSESAMERYQADNGWQSKVVPDSRALIKLGLGPGHEHLLNPESAMTSQPYSAAPHALPLLNQTPAMVIPPQK